MLGKIKRWLASYKESVRKEKNEPDVLEDYEIYPIREALHIAILYGILGVIWIAFPDSVISKFFDYRNFMQISILKGWAYVAVTVVLIFFLVHKRLLLYKDSLRKVEIGLLKEKENEEKLYAYAYYDSLTELPNRRLFEEWLENLLMKKQDQKHAVLYMDLDDFKNINDSMGHTAGDAYLKYVADSLNERMSNEIFVARLGGDEFAVVLIGTDSKQRIIEKINEIISFAKIPWTYEGQEFYGSVSIGIAIYPQDGQTVSLLLRNADIAMYQVKNEWKNNFLFYSETMQEENLRKILMINDLHHAIENREFELYYQPILDLKNYRLIGVEALIRWNHPKQGMISPAEFIPIAEESGLIYKIGDWVMQTAIRQKAEWEQKGYPHLKMSINVSGHSLIEPEFVSRVKKLLEETGVAGEEIQLEITETALIRKMNASITALRELRGMKIHIALDDFGTGYSSLTYLKNLPIDVVKLDCTFVRDMLVNGHDNVIVGSVIQLTRDLHLQIVAEGIENERQLFALQGNECDFGQGYLFSKPITHCELESFMTNSAYQTMKCISTDQKRKTY